MSTGAKKVDIFLKKFLTQQQITVNFFDYLEELARELFALSYPENGVFDPPPTTTTIISSSGPDTFTITTPLTGTDGPGAHIIVPEPTEYTDVSFQNTLSVDYFVGARFRRIPDGTEINVRTGEIKYTFLEEATGELAEPDVVVDDGDVTLTVTVDSVCEAGVSHAGRVCRIWLKNAVNQALAFEDVTVIFDGSNNKIETTAALGQTLGNISTDVSDYQVFLIGPTVRRNTDLRLDDDILFLGIVEGKGAGNTPDVFDQTDVTELLTVGGLSALFGVEHDILTGFHTDITPETIFTQQGTPGVQLDTQVNASDEDVPDAEVAHSLFASNGGTGIQGVKWRLRDSSGNVIAFIDAHGNAYFQNLAAVASTFVSTLVVDGNVTLGDDIGTDVSLFNSELHSNTNMLFRIDADDNATGHFYKFFNNTSLDADRLFQINEDASLQIFGSVIRSDNAALSIDLDFDNDDTGETFSITKDAAGVLLWFLNEFGDVTSTRDTLTEAATAYAKLSDDSIITGLNASLNEVFDQTKTRELLRATPNNPVSTIIDVAGGRLTIGSGEDFGLTQANEVVNYSGGTVDFATGTITGGGSNFTPFTPSGVSRFFKYGLVLDSSNEIVVILPTSDAATAGAAAEPTLEGGLPIAVITVEDDGAGGAGTINDIAEAGILRFGASGGAGTSVLTSLTQVVNNNQAALAITDLIFNKAAVVAARIQFRIHRETDDPIQLDETGEIFAWYRPVQDDWDVDFDSKGDDTEVQFTIDATGQVFYSSSLLAGVHVGEIKLTDIQTIPASAAPVTQTIVNNQAVAADVIGLLFNKVTTVAARMHFRLHRETDDPIQLDETGEIFAWFRPVQNDWDIDFDSKGDDTEVQFTITAAGQVQYTSSLLAGVHTGELKVQEVKEIEA